MDKGYLLEPRASNEELGAILDAISEVLWVLDLQGRIVFTNAPGVESIPLRVGESLLQKISAAQPRGAAEAILEPTPVEQRWTIRAGEREVCVAVKLRRVLWSGRPACLALAKPLDDDSLDALFKSDIFQLTPVMLAVATFPEGAFLSLNRAFVTTLGYTPEMLIGKTAQELKLWVTPGDRKPWMEQLATGERLVRTETTMSTYSGRHLRVLSSSIFVTIKGRPIAIHAIVDASEKHKVEEALRESEERFRAIFMHSPGIIAITDMKTGAIKAVNPKWSEAMGYSEEESLGKSPVELGFYPKGDALKLGERLVTDGYLPPTPLPLKHRDGKTRVTLFTSSLVTIGGRLSAINTGIDIEEQVRAQAALQESEERFRVLFESTPDAFLIHDARGIIVDGNRAAEALLGRPRRELVGGSFRALGLRPEREQSATQTGPEFYRLTRADGRELTLEVRAVSIQLKSQGASLIIARDITAQRKAEEDHRRMEEQLYQAAKMEAIGRLAGGIAHDFNNILSGILMSAELLSEELTAQPSLLEDVLEIERASHRAASLTSQLLAFSRQQPITTEVIDLNKLISNATQMLQRIIGENISLTFTLHSPTSIVRVDPNQIEQVLINLAVNSRDAMESGGRLSFETRNISIREEDCASHPERKPGDYVELTATDNGKGMAPEVMGRIFEPFFTTKSKGKGTGLGMSITYGVIQQNGGFVSVSSAVGHGTTFQVYLPRVQAAVQERVSTKHKAPTGHENILVVEDEGAVLTMVARFLRQQGFQISTAANGEEALSLVEAQDLKPDLLLTDVILPHINGRLLYEKLRKLLPQLKVIFISGYTDEIIANHGVLEEGVSFLQKPFRLGHLAAQVRSALDAPRVELPPNR